MQIWTVVKGNDNKNKAKNVYVVFEERKCKISTIVFIAKEIFSWLSPCHKTNSISVFLRQPR